MIRSVSLQLSGNREAEVDDVDGKHLSSLGALGMTAAEHTVHRHYGSLSATGSVNAHVTISDGTANHRRDSDNTR